MVQDSITVVLNPMGLRSDVQRSVLHVQDVTNFESVAAAVKAVCAAAEPAPVVLVGYSLGGITLPAYLGAHASTTPPNLVGCICVSGALKTDFISSPHYMHYYQPIIVAGIVRDLLLKYGRALRQAMGPTALASLSTSSTFFDLQRRLYASLPFPPTARRYSSCVCIWARGGLLRHMGTSGGGEERLHGCILMG